MQTIKIERNGYIFQIDPANPMRRYFGGGGTSVKTLDPYAGTGYRQMYKKFTDYLSPNVGAVTAYPGQLTPGTSVLQQMGFDVAGGLTPIASGGQQYAGDIYSQLDPGMMSRAMGTAETGLSDVLAPYDPQMAMQAVEPARKLALDTYFQDIVPGLKESYVAKTGSADAGALNRSLAREASRLSMGVSSQLAPYLYQGSEAQKNRQVQGVNQAMSLAGLPGQIAGQAGQIGGQSAELLSSLINMGTTQRQITGEQMAEPYQKWSYEQPYNNPYAQLLSTLQGAAPQYQYVGQEQGAGLGSQMLPMLGSFLGTETGAGMAQSGIQALLPMLLSLSDVRFKENFARITDALEKVKRLEGQTYRFKNNPERKAGLIAQEIETVLPEAVIEVNGVKFVESYAVIALLVNAIKELAVKVESIRKDVVGV